MNDKKALCPITSFWRKGKAQAFLSIFLGLALVGILLKSVFWTFFMGLFAIKWIFLIALGFFSYTKISGLVKKYFNKK